MNTIGGRHRGYSLLEVIAASTMASMLMMVAVALLHGVLAWGDGATATAARAEGLNRMEQTLRSQLQEATEVSIADNVLTVQGNASHAEWKIDGSACQLKVNHSDGSRHERYQVGPRVGWELVADNSVTEVGLDTLPGERGLPFRVVVAHHSETLEGEQ